jgi:hypothetical protein
MTLTPPVDTNGNGTATITATASKYYTAHNLVIPDTVTDEYGISYDITEIGGNGFYEGNLSGNLSLPNKLIKIADQAFACNSNETNPEKILSGNLVIPSSVTTIGENAFIHHKFSGDLIIPSSITSIGNYPFGYNELSGTLYFLSSATPVTLNGSIIPHTQLKSLNIDRDITLNHIGVFSDAQLSSIVGGNKINFNGCNYAVSNNAFISLDLNSFSSLPNQIFSNNILLKNVTITSSITSIGIGCFESCSGLESVKFENASTIDFGEYALGAKGPFVNCTKLKEIIFDGYNVATSLDGWTCNGLSLTSDQGAEYTNLACPFGTQQISDPTATFAGLPNLTTINSILNKTNFPTATGTISVTNSPNLNSADVLAKLKA